MTKATAAANGELPFDIAALTGAQKSHLKKLLGMPEPPLVNPAAAAEASVNSLFDLMARLVRVEHFLAVCGAEDFPRLYGAALLDLFTAYAEPEKARRLDTAAEDLASLREHPAYERICDRMRAEMDRLTATTTMDGLAEVLEPAMARELAKVAFGLGRDAAIAQSQFLDRRSPKMPRGGLHKGTTLVLTEGAARTIVDGEARMKQITPQEPKPS